MRPALLLLCLLTLAGCPRQSNETVPVARRPETVNAPMAPTAVKQTTAGDAKAAQAETNIKATRLSQPELKPPIDYLELGTGFKAAALPADVLADFPKAQQSADKAVLQLTADGETVWLHGFTTKANASEIGNYYSGLLGVKGFQSFENMADPGKGKTKRQRKSLRSWRSADKRYEVHVYDSGQVATAAGASALRPIYVVEVHDRPAAGRGGTGP